MPSPTIATSLQATPESTALAPGLISPAGAAVLGTARVTFFWTGELPNEEYGFRVNLRRGGNAPDHHTSPILDSVHWTVNLPGDADQATGEWRWSVSIVRRNETKDTVVTSDEWTFYYNPFGGGPMPFQSPLQEPASPLATPAP